jgi:gag-polypeptide of LTR copia-type
MDNLPENSHRSRYGIEKLRDHNYQNWSFQCRMLLSEKKVWKTVTGEYEHPKTVAEHEAELSDNERAKVTDAVRKKIQKEYDEWSERDEEALRIISFTVSDQLQGPIHYGKTAKGAWDELQRVHAPNDKQRKFSLMKRSYHLDMDVNSSLIEHERIFDDLVHSLAAIGKTIDPDELIILYANSLPASTFGNWIQGQMAFIDKMSITEFKGRVREEVRRLNSCGLSEASIKRDPDTVQANVAKYIFPPRKQNQHPCSHCGY